MAAQLPAGTTLTAMALTNAIMDIGITVNFTPSVNSSSNSFVNITNASMSFTKTRAATRLFVMTIHSGLVNLTGFGTFLTTGFGVNVDGFDYPTGWYCFNSVSDHRTIFGGAIITGLSAGTKTIQLRMYVAGQDGTSTFISDTNDRGSMMCFEVTP